jgi:lipoate-protein ligase B
MLYIAELQSIFDNGMTEPNDCLFIWQGRVPYSYALDLQMRICESKKHGFDKDVLLLLEHPPTITLGRSGKLANLLVNEEHLKSRGIDLWHVDRGGDITYHGPGQLVGYPILALQLRERDVHAYMHHLEESLICLMARFGIEATRDPRFTGVWTSMGKIAAMGVHISRWITRHGFALNVNTDLSYFDLIVPCGITGRNVTSMQKHLSRMIDLEDVSDQYVREFSSVFKRTMIRSSESALCSELRRYEDNAKGIDECRRPDIPAVGHTVS